MAAITLPPQPASVLAARQFVREFLAEEGVDAVLALPAVLLTSELVTNAVLYTGGDLTLRARPDNGGVRVEVHDTSRINDVLLEDTRDWFAQDRDGNVWYFGENTTLVDGGLPVDLSGSWTAGVDGARPGIIMKAHPAIGDFYRQEFLLREAEDLAEVKSLTDTTTVPYGSFDHCLETEESSSLAPGDVEHKFYAVGVGNLLTIDLETGERSELVQITTE